jgi:phosphatidylinositol-bisphosphatase
MKGTEKDIGGWFVHGKGIEETLAGFGVSDQEQIPTFEQRESVEDQEARRTKKQSTLPKNDPGVVPGDDDIGLYVLGLQEVIDVSSPVEALRPVTDPTAANRFKTALEYALPAGYTLIAEQQLIGLLLLIYASPSVAPEIKSVSTTSVGTGMMGYMGNKGAVTTRIILGETTRLVFVNCHLAAGAEKTSLERRNWDADQIKTRTKFAPIDDSTGIAQTTGEKIGDEDFAFWFGDLNYRLESIPGDDVRRLLMLHTRNEYDVSQARGAEINRQVEDGDVSTIPSGGSSDATSLSDAYVDDADGTQDTIDPASLQTTLSSLLPHDELHQQMQQRKAFHDGWREAPIQFLPTYKYDVGTVGVFDSSDKRRGPSWCDRILYRTRRDYQDYLQRVRDQEEAKKRDEEMKAKGLEDVAEDEDVLFDYDPDEDGEGETALDEPLKILTKDGFEDSILQEHYTAHQRVLSSDHKPLDSTFVLEYDAVVPELKAKVHAEVARELDRAENEGRPTITLIVDKVHRNSTGDGFDESEVEGVNFGRLHFGEPKIRNATIANTGQVPATVHFVNRPVNGGVDQEAPTPPWCSIDFDRNSDVVEAKSPRSKLGRRSIETSRDPPAYTLEPGDACTIALTARVEAMEIVEGLNAGSIKLDDVLILRVDGGRDHFLPIQGKWVRSGLDRSIDKFMKIPENIARKLQGQEVKGGTSSPHLTIG